MLKTALGPVAALLIVFFTDLDPGNPMVTRMAAITVWMAIWWLTEAVHLAVTAFVPFVFMPLLGIADPKVVAYQYMDQIIFLFIGGFLISFAVEKWGLHERLALRILMLTGTRGERVLLGVMLTSFFISMWISNTATVMMLLSAVLAIITMTDKISEHSKSSDGLAKALLIGLAYSATIGGMATLVGTPPNMVFLRAYNEAYPAAGGISFSRWFSIGFPVAVLMLAVCYLTLRFLFLKKETLAEQLQSDYFSNAYQRLGKMNRNQKVVGSVFVFSALLWFTRADIVFSKFTIPGWSRCFPDPDFVQDSTVAIFMSLLLFLIPSTGTVRERLLTWKEASKLPFDIILLFGSGFALAKGFEVSGLSEFLASKLEVFKGAPLLLVVAGVCTTVCVVSEFASNVASIQLVIPILIAFQKDMAIDPLLLLIPATLAASLGFMLPVATAPNTIAFGTNRIRVSEMAKAGLVMNISGILIVTLMVYALLS